MWAHTRAARGARAWRLLGALLWTLLGTAGAGCVHSARVERAHREALRDALEAHAFPLSPKEARQRLLALGVRPQGAVPVADEGCGIHGCGVRLGPLGRGDVRLKLTGAPEGPTRVEVVPPRTPPSRALLALLWSALGQEGLREALVGAARTADAEALEEWRTFRPRWGPTGAAYVAAGAHQAGVGARVGVRRWHEPHLLTGVLLESEWGTLSPSPGSPAVVTHLLALPARVELAPWSDFSEAHGLPDASFSLFAGPSVLLSGALGPGPHLGFRAGLGLQLLRAGDGVLLPLLVEMHLQHHALLGGTLRDVRLVVGVGF